MKRCVFLSIAIILIFTLIVPMGCRKARFVFSSLEITPSEVTTGERATISVDLSNVGSIGGTHTVTLSLDGAVIDTQEMYVPAGTTREVTFTVVKEAAGEYTVEIGNLSGALHVVKSAEFEISSLVVIPEEVFVGEEVNVIVGVSNTGGLAGDYTCTLVVNEEEQESKEVTLNSGEMKALTFKFTPPYTDGHCDIAVGDLSEEITVLRLADIRVTSVSVAPHQVRVGSDITVSLDIRNYSDVEGSDRVILEVDGQQVAAQIITLGGQDTATIDFNITGHTTGQHRAGADGKYDYFWVTRITHGGYVQYGGTYTTSRTTNIYYFDEVNLPNYGGQAYAPTTRLTHNELLQGDWTRGPVGTGETDWINEGDNRLDMKAGCLADSWEIPEVGTIIFHIREGVRWQDKPPLNGRTLTIEDVVFSINRAMSGGYFKYAYPAMASSIEVTSDAVKNTVTVTVPADQWLNLITRIPDYLSIVAPELTEDYGGETDWRSAVGTGPFILTNWIPNSQAILVRNPYYWETNPIGSGEGDQLPYIDELRLLIITDPTTTVAAFRAGCLDSVSALDWNYAEPVLLDTNIYDIIEWYKYQSDGTYSMYFRTDDPESPFSIKEVRQAMMLAIDQDRIVDEYYGGNAEKLCWPLAPTQAYMDAYMPLEELPEDVQALYGYDVAAAQTLLDQTPYAGGFDCSVICWNTPAMIDTLSMQQEMLRHINIEMEIDIDDYAVYDGKTRARNYGPYEILYTTDSANGTYLEFFDFRGPSAYNPSYINDPPGSDLTIEAAYQEMLEYSATWDEQAMMVTHHNLMPYLLGQAYVIPTPAPSLFNLWWPWLKNYYGTRACGYYNYEGIAKYIWIDQYLKRELGY